MHCNSAGKNKLKLAGCLEPEPTLEELRNLDLAGVVRESSQLDHRVLGTLISPGLSCPGVAGVLHLRVLGGKWQHISTCLLAPVSSYLTLKHLDVSLAHVTFVLPQSRLHVQLILHFNKGLARRPPFSEILDVTWIIPRYSCLTCSFQSELQQFLR